MKLRNLCIKGQHTPLQAISPLTYHVASLMHLIILAFSTDPDVACYQGLHQLVGISPLTIKKQMTKFPSGKFKKEPSKPYHIQNLKTEGTVSI